MASPQQPAYTIVPLNLAQSISSRNATLDFDAILYNCYPETTINEGKQQNVVRRFGYAEYEQFTAGVALGLFTFNNQPVSIIGSTLRIGTTVISTTINTTGGQYEFTLYGAPTGFVFTNDTNGYYYDGTTLHAITDANFPAVTVNGTVEIDTYTCVLNPAGQLVNSQPGQPGNWTPISYIQATSNPDPGVAIARYLQYVVCFCSQSMGFFYDNGNSPGSPFNRNISADQNVGCAAGNSVVATRNTIFWVGQTKQRGRSVYMLDGLVPKPISNTYIDRILGGDSLVNVYAYFIEINGHYLYILTLTNTNVTLVYDMQTNEWHVWSSSTLGTPLTSTSGSINGTVVDLTIPNHGLSNGDIVQITGAAPSQYLGTFIVNVVDSNNITYTQGTGIGGGINSEPINEFAINNEPIQVLSGGTLPPLTVTPWVQNFFRPWFYTFVSGTDLLLDMSSGTVYTVQQGLANDNGNFIYMSMRTESWDGGTNTHKFMPSFELVGDKFNDTAYVGFTDDDYDTYSTFRPIDLGVSRSQLVRCGRFRRRAVQVIYIGSYEARFYRAQMKVSGGFQ